jgi:hypothetical protein
LDYLKKDKVIVEGDLNFTLSRVKVWGVSISIDTVVDYFRYKFEGARPFDLELVNVRKTGPRSNKIKQMRKQNTEDTQYKRDTDLRGSPSVGYVHQRNCQVLPLLLSSK